MRDFIKISVFLIFICCFTLSAARPYWEKYCLELQLEAASVYGVNNSLGDTRSFLDKIMREEGYYFSGDDFVIEKDRNCRVAITLDYVDEISFFGITLKELRFTAEGSSKEPKGILGSIRQKHWDV
jgi:hypothetical protein